MSNLSIQQFHWPKSFKVDSVLSLKYALGLIRGAVSNNQGVLVVYDSSWELLSYQQQISDTFDGVDKSSWMGIQQSKPIGLIICSTKSVERIVDSSTVFSIPIVSLSEFSSDLSIAAMYRLAVSYIWKLLLTLGKSSSALTPSHYVSRRKYYKRQYRNSTTNKLLSRGVYPFRVTSSHKGQRKGRVPIVSRPPKP